MNAKEKRLGTKAQLRAIKNRERRMATAIFLVLILLIVIFSSYFTYNFLNQPQNQTTNPASSQLKAAIVDQLSLTIPNQTFIETATNTLKQANYTVDYYPGEKVTVEFYRNLPTHDYDLVLLRVHSAGHFISGNIELALFTSEPYSNTKYLSEQLTDCVGTVSYNPFSETRYFGITPKFVQQSTKDKFRDTIIIMMGCDGLAGTQMAKAFIEKEAKAYISWNGSVSSSHTDQAATQLLKHMVTEGQTISQAVENTAREVGPDEAYDSILKYYPLASGNYAIQG